MKQRDEQKLDEWQKWLEEFQGESDRAAAILGAAFADDRLGEMLKTFFVDDQKEADELLKPDGPLGTFSSRARLAYCLGFLTKDQFSDLRTIGKIRNEFAHGLHGLDFNDPCIRDLCGNLKTQETIGQSARNTTSRSLFIGAVLSVCQWIKINQLGIKQREERRKVREAPTVHCAHV